MWRLLLSFLLLSTAHDASGQVLAPQVDERAAIAAVAEERPDGTVVQRASSFGFPAALGPLRRLGVQIITPDNFMVRYGAGGPKSGGPWMDLIVYRVRQPLTKEADEVDALIRERWTASKVRPIGALPPGAADAREGWFHAQQQQLVATTGFVLVQRGGWFVKARGTSPDADAEAGKRNLLAAMQAVPWTWYPLQQTSLLRQSTVP